MLAVASSVNTHTTPHHTTSVQNPDIIGITESWTSSHIFASELSIDGYDLFRQDWPVDRDGGGVLLYVRSNLHAVQFHIYIYTFIHPYSYPYPYSSIRLFIHMLSKFPEQIWCYVLDSTGHRCYVGVCYRSPTVNIYGSDNHDLLQAVA